MSARTGRPYSRRQAGSPGQAALRRITRRLLGTVLFCSALAVAVAAAAEDQRLLNAVKQGRVEVARSLLADGASPDGPVLIEACGKRTTEMLRLLLEAGADPAAKVISVAAQRPESIEKSRMSTSCSAWRY